MERKEILKIIDNMIDYFEQIKLEPAICYLTKENYARFNVETKELAGTLVSRVEKEAFIARYYNGVWVIEAQENMHMNMMCSENVFQVHSHELKKVITGKAFELFTGKEISFTDGKGDS